MRKLVAAMAVLLSASAGQATATGSVAGPDTAPLSTKLQPMPQPAASQLDGFTTISLLNGTRSTFDIRPFGNGVRAVQSNGCAWTRAADWFSPSDSWANCGTSRNWHTAQARVRMIDSLYPLKLGSEGRYRRIAESHTGRDQDRTTICRVTGAEDVVRPGLPDTSAYVVECDDTRRVRTTWYAPGQGPIAFSQVSHSDGLEEAWIRAD